MTNSAIYKRPLPENCLLIVSTVAIIYAAYVLVFLYLNGFEACAIIRFGELITTQQYLPPGCSANYLDGYDGQFVYRLSIDPLLVSDHNYGVHIPNPAYRQQRILFPFIVNVLTKGTPENIAATMLAVNFVAVVGIAHISCRILERYGAPLYMGALIAFYPGFSISLVRGLNEPLAGLLVVAAISFALQCKWWRCAILISLATLTRETAFVLAIASGLIWLSVAVKSKRLVIDSSLATWLLPVITIVLWQAYLHSRWGVFPSQQSGAQPGLPLRGIYDAAVEAVPFLLNNPVKTLFFIEMLWILLFATIVAWFKTDAKKQILLPWILYGLLALCLPSNVWDNHAAFYQVLFEFHILAMLLFAMHNSLTAKCKSLLCGIWFMLWVITSYGEIVNTHRHSIAVL